MMRDAESAVGHNVSLLQIHLGQGLSPAQVEHVTHQQTVMMPAELGEICLKVKSQELQVQHAAPAMQ